MGLILYNGKLLITPSGKLATSLDCCCDDLLCTCDAYCDSPSYRITSQAMGCGGDPGVCGTPEVVGGTLTEKDPGTIPGTQPPCIEGGLQRYWSGRPSLVCGIPEDPLIEMACCSIGGSGNIYLRVNEDAWCLASSADECTHYWVKNTIGAAEIGNDPMNSACCGTWHLQVWCGTDPVGIPNCDLAPTNITGCS